MTNSGIETTCVSIPSPEYFRISWNIQWREIVLFKNSSTRHSNCKQIFTHYLLF